MCGIAGVVNLKSPDRARAIVQQLNRQQARRGPDGEGLWQDNAVTFGHRRLAVIDLSEIANQPMTNEDQSLVVVLNGEIYNYLELRAELEQQGHHFASHSDTETLVHGYEAWGNDVFAKLRGMFAAAIYDQKKQKVVLVRDRMGKKPLVYAAIKSQFYFASTLAALSTIPEIPHELNVAAVGEFFTFQAINAPRTIYQHIHKLPPGCFLQYDLKTAQYEIKRYFAVDFGQKLALSLPDAVEALRATVTQAVKCRLLSDVPLGVFLSGGLDSAIIAALTTQLRAPQKTNSFTIGFTDIRYDERSGAQRSAAWINQLSRQCLISHQQIVNPADFELLTELAADFGEPFADSSMLPTALLSKFAREQVTVCLSGDGADELFGGYERYLFMKYASYGDYLPQKLRQALFIPLSNYLSGNASDRSRRGRLGRALAHLSDDRAERYFNLLNRCPDRIRQTLFGPKLAEAIRLDGSEHFEALLDQDTSLASGEVWAELDQNWYLPGDILPKVDICSMRYNLELRSPFLDQEVVSLANQLPWQFKLNGSSRKFILHKAFADLLAPGLANAPKRGFGVPVGDWLRGAWQKPAKTVLLEQNWRSSGLLNPAIVEKIWNEHQKQTCDHSYLLWSLLIFSLFAQRENWL